MKVLIYMPFSDWIPHFATDLEIAAKHINNGDEVHIIKCSGDLPYCYLNAHHFKLKCIICKSTCDKGLNIINLPKQNIHEIGLNNFIHDVDLPDFKSIEELKMFKINNVDFGMAVASTLISMVRDSNPDVDQHKNMINKILMMTIGIYDAIEYHLKEIKPDVFYLFNGRFASLRPALRAAQNLNVKTFVHERAGVLQRYSLTENTYPHDIEYQKKQIEFYWNNKISRAEKEDIAKGWFAERRMGKDQSWHSFTKSQLKGNLPEDFDGSKTNIAIYISSEDEFEAIECWKNPIYKNQTDAINNIINADIDENVQFYLRIHPNLKGLKNTQTRELLKLNAPNLSVIPADAKIDSYELMDACEKVITFGSTMGIESVFWGKTSILIGRSLYEDVEGCYIPKTHDEVIDLINRPLDSKPNDAIKYGYWQVVRGELYKYYQPESLGNGTFMKIHLNNPIIGLFEKKILSFAKKPFIKIVLQFMLNPIYRKKLMLRGSNLLIKFNRNKI